MSKDRSLFQEDGLIQHRLDILDQVGRDEDGRVLAVIGQDGVQDIIPCRRVHAADGFIKLFWGVLKLSDILNAISNNIIQIFSAIITGVISYLGIRIKNLYQEYIQDKLKKEIVDKTVKYVEQTCKDVTCEEKKRKALEKSLEWMKEKKINVSDTELEILIESAVNCL